MTFLGRTERRKYIIETWRKAKSAGGVYVRAYATMNISGALTLKYAFHLIQAHKYRSAGFPNMYAAN